MPHGKMRNTLKPISKSVRNQIRLFKASCVRVKQRRMERSLLGQTLEDRVWKKPYVEVPKWPTYLQKWRPIHVTKKILAIHIDHLKRIANWTAIANKIENWRRLKDTYVKQWMWKGWDDQFKSNEIVLYCNAIVPTIIDKA